MNRRRIIQVLFVLLFMFSLYNVQNLSASHDGPIIGNEPLINQFFETADVFEWTKRYDEHGTTVNNGNGTYTYTTKIGTHNAWNGTNYLPYVWDSVEKTIKIGNATIGHNSDGSLTIDSDNGLLIGKLSWYAQYHFNSIWNNLTFDNYNWLGFTFNEYNITARQRFWGTQAEMNITITYYNQDQLKITVDLTNNAGQDVPVRVFWVAAQLENVAGNYEMIIVEGITVGVRIGNFSIGWRDVTETTPDIFINTHLDKPNRRAAIQFGNISNIVDAGATWNIDPDVSPSIATGVDDSSWRNDVGTMDGLSSLQSGRLSSFTYWAYFRFALEIPKDSGIIDADMFVYCVSGTTPAAYTYNLYRIDEQNPAQMEGREVQPVEDAGTVETLSISAYTTWYTFTGSDMETMVEGHVAHADWDSGEYIGWEINQVASVIYKTFEAIEKVGTANEAYMEVEYSLPNAEPVNDQAPTSVDVHDTDNFYSMKQDYSIISYVSDGDGYADITFVTMHCWNDAHDTEYWSVEYDQDGDTFSEDADASNYIVLNTGTSSDASSGNDIDVTWEILFNWNHPDLTNLDFTMEVIDAGAAEDEDTYETSFDVESDLAWITSPTVTSDDSGTVDRGDLDETFYITGDVEYEGSGTSVYPPSTAIDIWVSATAYGTNVGPWETDAFDSGGEFTATCYADDAVGQDTYTLIIVAEAGGSGGTDLVTGASPTDTYIADRIDVYSATVTDGRIDTSTQGTTTWYMRYDYLDQAMGDVGTFILNGSKTLVYVTTNTWQYQETKTTVQSVGYEILSVAETTHGITGFNQVAADQTIIWDRMIVTMFYASNNRTDTGTTVEIRMVGYYEYDDNILNSGTTFTLNSTYTATWDSGNSWWDYTTSAYDTVGARCFNITSITDGGYSLTVWIWGTGSSPTVDNNYLRHLNREHYEVQEFTIELWYMSKNLLDSDVTGIPSGQTGVRTYGGITYGGGLWPYRNSADSSGLLRFYNIYNQTTGTVSATYTNYYDYEPYTWYHFVIVYYSDGSWKMYQDGELRSDVSSPANFDTWFYYGNYYLMINAYDQENITCVDDVRIYDKALTADEAYEAFYGVHDDTDTISYYKFSANNMLHDEMGTSDFSVVGTEANIYGLGALVRVVWDEIQVQSYSSDDSRINIATASSCHVTIYYAFDSHVLYSGTVTVNGVATSYSGASGIWNFGETEGSVTGTTYDTIAVSGCPFGITVEDQNSQSLLQIWDRIQVQSYSVSDARDNINENVNIDATLHYEYDSADVTDGTVTINTFGAAHQGSGVWRITKTSATVTSVLYDTVGIDGDDTYGISVIDQNSQETTVIWDRIQVTGYTISDARDDINDYIQINVTLIYDFDNTEVTDGTITIDGESATHIANGIWNINITKSSVQGITYNTIVPLDNTHGITVVDENGQSQLAIWDSIQVQSYSSTDSRINIGVEASMSVLLWYDYDNTNVTDGDFEVNGFVMTYSGADGIWNFVDTEASVTGTTYNSVVITVANEYGITEIDQNAQSLLQVWDKIVVQTTVVDDPRVDINTNVEIRVTLWLAYDSTYLGSGDSVTLDGVAMTWDSVNSWFDLSRSKAAVGLWNYFVNSSSEATYGITALDVNSQSEEVIWDRVQVQGYFVSDARDNINDNVDIDVTLWYDFDDSQVTDGTVTINGYSASHQGSGVWRITRTSASVTSVTYNNVQATGNTHGITVEDQNSQEQEVIWDQIVVQTTVVDDGRVNIDGNVEIRVTLWLDFDDSYLGSGDSVTLDGQAMTWDAGNSWFDLARAQSTVGLWNYFVNSSSEATYGITALDLDGQSVDVIWDRLKVTLIGASDTSVLSGVTVTIYATVVYEYDSTPMTAGTSITIEGIAMTYDSGDARWECTDMEPAPVSNTYDDMAGTGTLYGITVWNMNGKTVMVTWSDNLIDVTLTINYGWTVVGYNITISWTATYEPSGLPFEGTITINSTGSTFYPSYDSTGLRAFTTTAVDDPLYGIVALDTNTVSVTWDSIVCSSITYDWEMFDLIQVQMVLATGTFSWEINATSIGASQYVLVYVNSTLQVNKQTDASSQIGTQRIGPFGQNWYYGHFVGNATATVGARTFTDTWWDTTVPIPVGHTIHLADFDANENDAYIWFTWSTVWNNGTFTLWDNDTLVAYIDMDPGTYRLDKSVVVGLHNLTILLNCTDTGGHQSEQTKDFSVSDYWLWLNFDYTMIAPYLDLRNIAITGSDDIVAVQCWIAEFSGFYYVFENETYIDVTGTFTAYTTVFITWTKNANGVVAWDIKFNTSAADGHIYGIYYKAIDLTLLDDEVFGFTETLADDLLMIPDSGVLNIDNEIDSSSVLLENESNILYTVEVNPKPLWRMVGSSGYDFTYGGASNSSMIDLWILKTTGWSKPSVTWAYYLKTPITVTTSHYFYMKFMFEVDCTFKIGFWDGTAARWTSLMDADGLSWTYVSLMNVTARVPAPTGAIQRIYIELSTVDNYGTSNPANHSVWVDYHGLTPEVLSYAGDTAYAESFYDVADWSTSDTSIATDGDIGTITENGAGSTGRAYASFSSTNFVNYYYEFSISGMTATTASLEYWDGTSYHDLLVFTGIGTYKGIILASAADTMQRIGFYIGSEGGIVYPDYLRISSAYWMGYQHDMSSIVGLSCLDSGTIVAGQDTTTFTADGDGSSFIIEADNTTTAAIFSCTSYQMLAVYITSGSGSYTLEQYDGSTWSTVQSSTAITAGLKHFNILVVSVNATQWRINLTASGELVLDYFKAYSIAYYTITQSGVDVLDTLYVSSDVLIIDVTDETDDSYYFLLAYDPTLSINTAIYNIWNMSLSSNDYTKVQFNIGGWSDWEDYGDTRGDFTSGTLTSFKIQIAEGTNQATLTSLAFTGDSVLPIVATSSASPVSPHTSSILTLAAVVTDNIIVYRVYFVPIVAPDGFSIQSYFATESDDNLWSYTFSSSLVEGYYYFKVIAWDGYNFNELTEGAYIGFTVSQEQIVVYIRIFDSIGDWVPFETFEVYRNSTRQYTDTFTCYTDEAWQIQVKDRFGETLNTTTFSAGLEELVIVVLIHSLKVQSWHYDYVFFNITRGGITYSEVIAPLEIQNFRLFNNTYTWVVDYRNGTTIEGGTTLTSSTAIVITGNTIADVANLSATLLEMTTEINVTITSTNNQVLTISIDLTNINTTINDQIIQVLLDLTNVNSTVYDQTVDLLAEIQNTNTTIYNQLATFIVGVYANQSTIFDQTIDILTQLTLIDSNITANYISLYSSLDLINSSLVSNFTSIVATLSAIDSNITTNYLTLAATLLAMDTNLYANFTSISADLLLIDSSLYSNFTAITSTLSAVGSNITSNYLSLAATLLAMDSNLYANFTSISAELLLIDSNLYSNFTAVTSTLSAIGSNVTTNYLSVIAELVLIDSSLAANFTEVVAQVLAVNSSIAVQFLLVVSNLDAMNATMFLIDDPTHLNPLVLGYSLSDDYCDFTVVTTWHNATIDIYDNNVYRTGPTSELLSPIRYTLLGTSGTHNLSLYIDGGTDSFWYNISYTVAETIAFAVNLWDVDFEDVFINIFCQTTYGNATLYIYDNDVYKAYSPEADIVQYRKDSTEGVHVLSIKIDAGGSLVIWKNVTYSVAIMVESMKVVILQWDTGSQDSVSGVIQTNWNNATITLTQGTNVVGVGTESGLGAGVDFYFRKAQASGVIHLITVMIDGGGGSVITLILGYSYADPFVDSGLDPAWLVNQTLDIVEDVLSDVVVIPPAVFGGIFGLVVLLIAIVIGQLAWNWKGKQKRKKASSILSLSGYLPGGIG